MSWPAKILFLALLLAVAVRSIIPVGFMPDTKPTQFLAMTICSGLDIKTIYIEDKQQPSPHNERKELSSCPFASPVLAYGEHNYDLAIFLDFTYTPIKFSFLDFRKKFLGAPNPYEPQGPPALIAA